MQERERQDRECAQRSGHGDSQLVYMTVGREDTRHEDGQREEVGTGQTGRRVQYVAATEKRQKKNLRAPESPKEQRKDEVPTHLDTQRPHEGNERVRTIPKRELNEDVSRLDARAVRNDAGPRHEVREEHDGHVVRGNDAPRSFRGKAAPLELLTAEERVGQAE